MKSQSYRMWVEESGAVLGDRIRPAHSWMARLRGLLGVDRLGAGEGLWLRPCRAVHTHFMSICIDIIFLDAEGKVLSIHSGVTPWVAGMLHAGAHSVLELPSGTADKAGLRVGQRVRAELARVEG